MRRWEGAAKRRRWSWKAAARGAGGAGRRSSGAGAGAAGARRWRGAWRGGVVEQERHACGSGGAAQEWRQRSGVRVKAWCRAAVSRGGRKTV